MTEKKQQQSERQIKLDDHAPLNPDRKIFIMARGFQINEQEQIVQFLVPGFNMVESLKMPWNADDGMINKAMDSFRLKVSGDIQDWAQALASADKDKKAKYKQVGYDQDTYDTCWLVNEAVEGAYQQLSQQK